MVGTERFELSTYGLRVDDSALPVGSRFVEILASMRVTTGLRANIHSREFPCFLQYSWHDYTGITLFLGSGKSGKRQLIVRSGVAQ